MISILNSPNLGVLGWEVDAFFKKATLTKKQADIFLMGIYLRLMVQYFVSLWGSRRLLHHRMSLEIGYHVCMGWMDYQSTE